MWNIDWNSLDCWQVQQRWGWPNRHLFSSCPPCPTIMYPFKWCIIVFRCCMLQCYSSRFLLVSCVWNTVVVAVFEEKRIEADMYQYKFWYEVLFFIVFFGGGLTVFVCVFLCVCCSCLCCSYFCACSCSWLIWKIWVTRCFGVVFSCHEWCMWHLLGCAFM